MSPSFNLQKFLVLFGLLFLLNCHSARAEFLYSPVYIVVKAPEGTGSGSVTISNPTERPVRMQLSLSEWDMSPTNQVVIKEAKDDASSVASYVKLNPLQFTLPPKQKRIVRIACALPSNFPNQEYKLLLNMLEIGAERKELDAPDKFSFGLIINRQISAGTYIRKGKPNSLKSNLQIKDLTVQKASESKIYNFSLSYQNLGNIHSRRTIGLKFFDKAGDLVGEKAGLSGFLAVPTEGNNYISFKGSFELPKDLLEKKEQIKTIQFSFIDDPIGEDSTSEPIRSDKLEFTP